MRPTSALDFQADQIRKFTTMPDDFYIGIMHMVAGYVEERIGLPAFALKRIRENETIQKIADNVLMISGYSMIDAEPVFVNEEVCNAIFEIADSMPEWTLTPEPLPTPAGLIYFETPQPLPFDQANNAQAFLVAVTWAAYIEDDDGARVLNGNEPVTPDKADGVYLTYWQTYEDVDTPLPVAWAPWPMNRGWLESIGYYAEQDEKLAATEIPDRLIHRHRFVAATLALIEQKVFVPEPESVDRTTRRRFERETKKAPHRLNVLKLRTRREPGDPAEPHPVEWSCSWIVRGHWRQQPYGPNGSLRKPKWIRPFVKGDPEKPLRITPRVLDVR